MAREREGKSQKEEEDKGKICLRENIKLGPDRCEREAGEKPVEF